MKVEELKGKPFEGLVNVTQLLKQPVGSNRSYHIDEILDEKDKGSIQGKVMLIHTGRGILVQGELTAEVELICSRCLASFLYLLNFTIEEEFLPTIDISSGLPLSSSEESVDFTIDSKNMLDLGEIIRQHVLLNLPMKPLCRPDCAGIKEISSYGST